MLKAKFIDKILEVMQEEAHKIWIDNKEVSSLNEMERNNIKNHFLGFVFQFHYLMSEFTALENVEALRYE